MVEVGIHTRSRSICRPTDPPLPTIFSTLIAPASSPWTSLQVKATLIGNKVTWSPFIVPANMSKPRTANIWTRVKKNAATFIIPPATITANADAACEVGGGALAGSVASNQSPVRALMV